MQQQTIAIIVGTGNRMARMLPLPSLQLRVRAPRHTDGHQAVRREGRLLMFAARAARYAKRTIRVPVAHNTCSHYARKIKAAVTVLF